MIVRSLAASICLFAAVATAGADADDDKQVFESRCAKCHAEAGTGTFMLGRRLGKERARLDRRDDLTPLFIRHVVRNGIVSMPPITRVEVTDEELEAIVRYLTRKQD